ncbi:P-type conjugative transfer protein TrbL [Hydrotalea sp. AMD]|uniref:P-type conjugative transfer protein TrbL n=1 Tax=Hydrotalea sp. AMD TaxID=2501297 RepID=UPI00257F2CD0|nr:P-type conjugative transfer protein TrbL [Hydrotalea sp. AMD]
MEKILFKRCFSILLLYFSFFYSSDIFAAIDSSGILDDVMNTFKSKASAWQTVITAKANFLFWSLATISMVWTFGMLHLKNAGIGEFFGEFSKFTISLGFFNWLLLNGPQMATAILDSMKQIGASASGNGGIASPSTIVDIGFSIFYTITNNDLGPIDSVIGFVLGLIILVVVSLIGVNFLILYVSGWILAYAGVFVLGFGGSRWTSDIAISYYKTALNIGVQMLAMLLIVGIGSDIINDYFSRMSQGSSMAVNEMAVIMIVAIVLLQLTNKIPPLIGGLVMGGGTHALGQGFGTAHAMAAMSAAASAFTAGASMLTSAGANAIGGGQALKAAFEKQAEYDAIIGGGSAAAMSLAPDYNSGSGSGGKTQAGQSSPFSDFMGHTNSNSSSLTGTGAQSSLSKNSGQVKPGGSVVSTLTKGAVGVIGDKIQSRVNQSAAGQLTAAIKNMEVPTQAEPAFGENSLSGPTTEPTSATGGSSENEINYAEEVAEFVNSQPNRSYDE